MATGESCMAKPMVFGFVACAATLQPRAFDSQVGLLTKAICAVGLAKPLEASIYLGLLNFGVLWFLALSKRALRHPKLRLSLAKGAGVRSSE